VTKDEFRDCLVEYYQSEVLGEAFFEAALQKFVKPDHRYKIGNLLQLETETKARLRPTILELGGSVEELDSSRETGHKLAESLTEGNWSEFVVTLNQAGEPLTNRQREVAEIAPAPFLELANSMRVHGESIQNFTALELAGNEANSLNEVIDQLKFPLKRPEKD
jgi:hypothetical protein